MLEITPAQQYSATMDSVNLINGAKHELLSDADWADVIARNKEHIAIMLAKDFWSDEDLTPFENAIGKYTVV
jgi:hypothetical protein